MSSPSMSLIRARHHLVARTRRALEAFLQVLASPDVDITDFHLGEVVYFAVRLLFYCWVLSNFYQIF